MEVLLPVLIDAGPMGLVLAALLVYWWDRKRVTAKGDERHEVIDLHMNNHLSHVEESLANIETLLNEIKTTTALNEQTLKNIWYKVNQ